MMLKYPTGSLVRTEYEVRVVVGEGIPGAQGREIVSLAESWLRTLRQVVVVMDQALEAEWVRQMA